MVCRQAFISIHGITSGRVQHLAHFAQTSPTTPVDKRGKQPNKHATSEDIKKQIRSHIKSFPTIGSHYGRGNMAKGKKFLSTYLSVAKMHQLYLEKFEPEASVIGPQVTYQFYLNFFNTNFNLSFGVPKTDTCATCDSLDVTISDTVDTIEKQKLQDEKQAHLMKSQQFYAELQTCTTMAKENSNIACISFDFEKNLPLPHIPTNDIFYLRQLSLYVFGVHDCRSNSSIMYSWPESVAHRGANEVVSCLNHYFSTFLKDVDTLLLFSDSCGGQNKNSIVIHFLFSLVRLGRFHQIQHFFPVRGHSFLPCDRDFAKTDTKKKTVERVYLPEHWFDVIRSAKKTKPFNVVPVTREMIHNHQTHFSSFLKKTCTYKKERMSILEGMLFEYSHSHPKEVWIKYSLMENDWHKFPLEKKGVSKDNITFSSTPAYQGGVAIDSAKVDDLKKIVYKFVPREFRDFYNAIISDNILESTSSQTDVSDN